MNFDRQNILFCWLFGVAGDNIRPYISSKEPEGTGESMHLVIQILITGRFVPIENHLELNVVI